MGNTGNKAERGRSNIHFAVADQNVAVAAEPLDALVLMHIFVISVQEIPMADDQIEHRVGVAIRLFGITSENVEDDTPVVIARRHLAIAIVGYLTTGIGQTFDLVALWICTIRKSG